jgi:RimJ/RimL family protein N-acetyltransferase
MPTLHIRLLGPDDHIAYRTVRRRALREEPTAFNANEEDESAIPLPVFAERLRHDASRFMLGAFHDDALIGIVGVTREQGTKEQHKAFLRSMYVDPEHRGLGVGRQLLAETLALVDAIPGLRQVTLTVTAGNHGALALYEAHGFHTCGREPDALFVQGAYHDEWMMMRRVPAR